MDHIIKFPRPNRRPNPGRNFTPLLVRTLRVTLNIDYGVDLGAILGTGNEKDNAQALTHWTRQRLPLVAHLPMQEQLAAFSQDLEDVLRKHGIIRHWR